MPLLIVIDPHAEQRMVERGASREEVIETIETGETFLAKHGRTGFRKNFVFGQIFRSKRYAAKQLEVYAISENDAWIVITIIVKYF